MANKYSNYRLKPAVSTYVDPQSDEVMTLLRERYDNNKAKKDLVDRTLANTNVLEGDSHILESTKSDIRKSLEDIVQSGAYEKAGLIIDEAIASMETNEGLLAADKSYKARQEELEWIKEQERNGVTILDFGKFDSKLHSSYNYNEDTGKYDINVYQPKSQGKLKWNEAIQASWKGIKANSHGLTTQDILGKSGGAYALYMESNEGQQHFRSLTELDYDSSIPFEERRKMAQKEILKIQSAGMMYRHNITKKENR